MICLQQHVEEELGEQRRLMFLSLLLFLRKKMIMFWFQRMLPLGFLEDIMQIGNLSLLSSCDYARNGP